MTKILQKVQIFTIETRIMTKILQKVEILTTALQTPLDHSCHINQRFIDKHNQTCTIQENHK